MLLKKLPQIIPQKLAIKLKPAAQKAVRHGHPWIFESGIIKQNKEGNAGDLAIIFDQRRNKFLAIGLFDPHSPIRIKILQTEKAANIDTAWFQEKIETAFAKRFKLLKTDTNSYRFIYGENDGLPGFIADVYDNVLVIKLYSTIWFPYLKMMLPVLLDISNCKTLVLRLARSLQKMPEALYGLSDGMLLHGDLENEEVIFREYGLRFTANVIHGHKTGYFLDHRHNRKRVGELAKGKTVLDIFAYAGGFSVHALAGGATEVTSLDISAKALKMSEKNVALNDLKANHQTMAIDAFKGLEQLYQEGKTFDLIIVDPPSFAKRESEREKAMDSYMRLAKMSLKIVARNGILLLASCSSRVTSDEFFALNEQVLRQSGRKFQEMERHFHDIDHPIGFKEGAYLKAIYYQMD
ncbi:MAG: 23S rRNA (cytosine1962-C5)-methyltransferase [Paraglaciecola sp.]|jgi:23S rRNA (cytosine1962-C5)-methyltransferase